MPEDTPLVITEHDMKDQGLLLRYLRKVSLRMLSLGTRLGSLERAPQPPTFDKIRNELQAGGSKPLNVISLLGVLQQPQLAGVPRVLTAPTGQVLQQLQDTQLLIVGSTSTGYALNSVLGGNPTTLYQLIQGLSTSTTVVANPMTLDTVQTSTGAKTIQGQWTFVAPVLVGSSSYATPGWSFTTSTNSGIVSTSTGTLGFAANGTGVGLFSTGSFTVPESVMGAAGAVGGPEYTFSTSTGSGMFSPALNQLGFTVAGTEIIHASSSGSVGISQPSPRAKLDIGGTIAAGAFSWIGLYANVPSITAVAGNARAVQTDGTLTAGANNDTLVGLYLDYTGVVGAFTGVNQYALYQPSSGKSNYFAGKVGLGTTSPNDVAELSGGNFRMTATSSGQILAAAGSAVAPAYSFTTSTQSGVYSTSTGTVSFSANGTQVMLGSSNTIQFPNGKVTNYNTLGTTGWGVPAIIARSAFVNQTATIASQTLYATTSTGEYRLQYYINTATSGTGNATLTYTFTNDLVGQTKAQAAMNLTAANDQQGVFMIRAVSLTNIAYLVDYTANGSYDVYVLLEKLS